MKAIYKCRNCETKFNLVIPQNIEERGKSAALRFYAQTAVTEWHACGSVFPLMCKEVGLSDLIAIKEE